MKFSLTLALILGLALFLGLGGPAAGQKAKPMPKDQPQLIASLPFGVAVGTTSHVIVVGLGIDTAKEVRIVEPGCTVKILRKNKINVNNQVNPKRVGDSEFEIELKVPADYKGTTASMVVVTPQGESQPHKLLIDAKPVIADKEPNNSFQQAQSIPVPATVEGRIEQAQDVDVYKLEGTKGQKLVIDVMAARLGGALDSILLLHNGEGQLLDSNDDADPSGDSHLEVVLPKTGVYYLSILDANDHGGTAYSYRLSVQTR